ncbi:thioredoxin family protein [Phreatobacter cathodiphilus]|uniref:Thiol reductase thioredoxin n=1 Tax=Phreatobacter cathodiphilus TaxID=1868589 RepID=A0A2S0N813_9HYPH|nr:thioredoxin family protein [Phreatobacter cathodiphilus]AVO44256.1 thiol reductase thioredoxin [Phreatobacter cathodiphilus]
MIRRRTFILASAALAAAAPSLPASAAGQRFTQAAFAAAQAAGKPILVEVTAPWCPTCRAQQPILQKLTAEPRFRDLVFLSVDFDSQKDVLRALNVQSQSTLVVFKGRQEVGRSAGDTNAASITALVAKSI